MTVHLSGVPAFLALLPLCVAVCSPVWFLTRWASRAFTRGVLEPRFRREMAALGVPAEQIDRDWEAIQRGDWPHA